MDMSSQVARPFQTEFKNLVWALGKQFSESVRATFLQIILLDMDLRKEWILKSCHEKNSSHLVWKVIVFEDDAF